MDSTILAPHHTTGASEVRDLQIWIVELCDGESICSHVLCPVPRVHDGIVENAEKSVEPEGFLFMLDEADFAGFAF